MASFHDGFQFISPQSGWQGSWGSMRANLSRAAWDGDQPYFRMGNGTPYYLHGHMFSDAAFAQSYGRAPYDQTLGCVGTPNEYVLNRLSTATSQGASKSKKKSDKPVKAATF
jgi:hypothetical protein